MNAHPLLFGLMLASGVTSAALTLSNHFSTGQQMGHSAVQLPVEGVLPSMRGANGWLNSEALTPAGLRGKVVLVQFWTYSCIYWIRTMPHVRAWSEKYRDQGLVVLGVHTPEFEFEKSIGNVTRAAKDMRIGYPIAVDSDYAIWRAFDNRYWPALYLVDANGRIRYHHFGEGEYEQTERVIQRLLEEAGARGIGTDVASVHGSGLEAAADWDNLKSPETYVGYRRAENLASPSGAGLAKPHVYAFPGQLGLNRWALAGDWTIEKESAALNRPNGRIAYRFHARDVHLVMGPAVPGTSIRFRVSIDKQPPGDARGADVDRQGFGRLTEQRLYQLIRQPSVVGDRRFEIEFLDPGAEAFVFTFG
jgi:thiol-disulfide isomerase/thioredoxin